MFLNFLAMFFLVLIFLVIVLGFFIIKNKSWNEQHDYNNEENDLIKIKLLNEKARMPLRNNINDAGLDLLCYESHILKPGVPVMINTGVSMELPDNTVGMICDRSSMGKKGIKVLGGIIDEPYRGECKVCLINLTHEDIIIDAGDKVAQMLILPVLYLKPKKVDTLSQTLRGDKGFGSSGK